LPTLVNASAAAEVMMAPLAYAGREAEQLRDAAMLELLYGSGLRVSELAGLDLDHLALESAEVRVLGKGRKERIVPLGSKAIAALSRYLEQRALLRHETSGAQDPQAVFLARRGNRLG